MRPVQTLPSPAPDTAGQPRLRGWVRVLALAYALFVVYGSLVPLNFTPLPWAEAIERFRNLAQLQFTLGTRADWGANLLLFVPLAALAAAAVGPYPQRHGGRRARLLVLGPACLALSVLIEFLQVYFPPRVVSLNDIVAQALGTTIGLSVWWAFAPAVERWLHELPLARGRSSLAQQVLAAYLVLLFAYSLLPLDLTISPVEIYHKWREGRVLLLPLAARSAGWAAAAYEYISDVAIWIPVAVLRQLARPRPAARAVLGVVALAALLELLQLFVFTRVVDVSDVLMAALGGWLGVRLAGRLGSSAEAPGHSNGRHAAALRWLALTFVWLIVLVVVFWFPFDFQVERSALLARLQALSRVPFETYQQGSELHAATQLLHKLGFFIPLGVALERLAVALAGRRPPAWLGATMLAFAAACALGIEAGQLLLPGKVADGTDALLEWLGAALGFGVASWWVKRWAPAAGSTRLRSDIAARH